MNLAVTIAVKKVDGKLQAAIISDPNIPHRDQRRNFRKLRRELFGQYDEVQLWTSSAGRVKRQKTTDKVLPDQIGDTSVAEQHEDAAETQQIANSNPEPTPSAGSAKRGGKKAKETTSAGADLLG